MAKEKYNLYFFDLIYGLVLILVVFTFFWAGFLLGHIFGYVNGIEFVFNYNELSESLNQTIMDQVKG